MIAVMLVLYSIAFATWIAYDELIGRKRGKIRFK